MDFDSLASRSLYVIIHHQVYPVTSKVLYELFSSYGHVERVCKSKSSIDFHARIQFFSRTDARRAFQALEGRCIYDDCCELEIWPACTQNLPIRGAYEADLLTASLEPKRTYHTTLYSLPNQYHSAVSHLRQPGSTKYGKEAIAKHDSTTHTIDEATHMDDSFSSKCAVLEDHRLEEFNKRMEDLKKRTRADMEALRVTIDASWKEYDELNAKRGPNDLLSQENSTIVANENDVPNEDQLTSMDNTLVDATDAPSILCQHEVHYNQTYIQVHGEDMLDFHEDSQTEVFLMSNVFFEKTEVHPIFSWLMLFENILKCYIHSVFNGVESVLSSLPPTSIHYRTRGRVFSNKRRMMGMNSKEGKAKITRIRNILGYRFMLYFNYIVRLSLRNII